MATTKKAATAKDEIEVGSTQATNTDVIEVAAGTDIAEYQPHEAEIVRVEKKFANVIFECSTTKGLEEAKEARVEIRAVRYALDKTKKTAIVPYQQAVKDAQARVNQVKAFGDELIERVLGVETPIDEAIKAQEKIVADEKARLAEEERVRVEGIQVKLAQFRNVASAYASRSAEDIAKTLESLKASVILPDFYAEFEAEATIARDNAIDQMETLHAGAVEREAAAVKLAAQQAELEELREKQRLADEEAERIRKERAEEDRLRLKQQQDALDKQRLEMEEQQRKQREQQEEQQRQQQARDAQYQRDQEELARLRAQAATPAPVVVPAPVMVAAAVEVAPIKADPQPEHVAESQPVDGPTAAEIIEVVALGFDISEDEAAALLRATRF